MVIVKVITSVVLWQKERLNRLMIKLIWEPRDLWVGVYWDHADGALRLYICLIPCLPILVAYQHG